MCRLGEGVSVPGGNAPKGFELDSVMEVGVISVDTVVIESANNLKSFSQNDPLLLLAPPVCGDCCNPPPKLANNC